jgi:hypothetical protein
VEWGGEEGNWRLVSNGLSCGSSGGAEFGEKWWV